MNPTKPIPFLPAASHAGNNSTQLPIQQPTLLPQQEVVTMTNPFAVSDTGTTIVHQTAANVTARTNEPISNQTAASVTPRATQPSSRRGRGRGRGRGRARTVASSTKAHARRTTAGHARRFNYPDPSDGWTIQPNHTKAIKIEGEFAEELVGERARLYCLSVVEGLNLQKRVRDLPDGRAGFIVMFIEPVLKQCMEWENESIKLHKMSRTKLHLDDMYRFLAVFLLSHCTGFSISKSIAILRMVGHGTIKSTDIRFIASNILAFKSIGRGNSGMRTWNSMRDQTQQLGDIERIAFSVVRKIFFGTTSLFATLDDDLFGTRAVENQVKSLSPRKADKEGHTADVVADALFRIVLGMRFRRRGETVEKSVNELMSLLMEGRGEEAVNGLIVTADRGYGKISLIGTLNDSGASSMVVLPDHLLKCHPFVGKSYLRTGRDDEIEDDRESGQQEAVSTQSSDHEQRGVTTALLNSASTLPAAQSTPVTNPPPTIPEAQSTAAEDANLDRKRAFVIDDNPNLAPEVFHAFKRTRRGGKHIHAVAVRERGTEKFSKILRFFFLLPDSLSNMIHTWIAVPRPNTYTEHLFYDEIRKKIVDDDEAEEHAAVDREDLINLVTHRPVDDLKARVQASLKENCRVLTVSQRTADWFLMRQFRITGTNAGKILLSNPQFRSLVGLIRPAPVRTPPDWSKMFVKSWFSSARSTEGMMRGSVNEDAVVSALRSQKLVQRIYECGMFCDSENSYIACSPDAVCLLDLSAVSQEFPTTPYRVIVEDEKQFAVASVEIKSVIAENTVGQVLPQARSDVVKCRFGDAEFKQYVPYEHSGQIAQQMVVMSVNFCLYVRATESSICYIVLVQAPSFFLDELHTIMDETAKPLVQWAHSTGVIPTFYSQADKDLCKARFSFWKLVNDTVKQDGAFPPLKLFKHGAQTLYSKTKGGVDGATQARAILRSSTSHLKWEQKLVSQMLKTMAVDVFISWRIYERRDLLSSKETYQCLDKFRHSLNNVQPFAEFIFDASREVLDHASSLTRQRERAEAQETSSTPQQIEVDQQTLPTSQLNELSTRAKACRRNRLHFFNSDEMKTFRKAVGHTPKLSSKAFCALCGVVVNGNRGHMSSYKCSQCHVNLCLKVYCPWRASCWAIWHVTDELRAREVERAAPDEEESDEDEETEKEETEEQETEEH